MMVDIQGGREHLEVGARSYSNVSEASAIVYAVQRMVQCGLEGENIGVICLCKYFILNTLLFPGWKST